MIIHLREMIGIKNNRFKGNKVQDPLSSELLVVACTMGFQGGTSDKDPTCQCRRHKRLGFAPWVGKIPWKREWQPTLVFLPGESHGQRSPDGLQSAGPRMGSHRVRHSGSDLTWKTYVIGQIISSYFILRVLFKVFIKSLQLPFPELPSRCCYY